MSTLNNALDQRRLKSTVDQLAELRREKILRLYWWFAAHAVCFIGLLIAVAASDATAFVCGESGTGKELAGDGYPPKK